LRKSSAILLLWFEFYPINISLPLTYWAGTFLPWIQIQWIGLWVDFGTVRSTGFDLYFFNSALSWLFTTARSSKSYFLLLTKWTKLKNFYLQLLHFFDSIWKSLL